MVKILSLALVGALLQPFTAFATDLTTLEPVVVTATRFSQPASQIPSSTTVITAEEIISSGARDLGEILRDATSVDVSSNGPRGATSLAKIRGSSAEQVLVLLDGIRLNSEQNGNFDLNSLPVSLKDIERIEIVRGPASALYGSAASGGVIQIFTRKPEARPSTTLNWNEGSYDTRNFGLSHGWQIGEFYYRLGASADRSNGYRDNSELNQENYNGLVGINLPGGYNIEASTYYLDKDNGVPGATFYTLPNANQRDRNIFSQFKVNGSVGPIQATARLIYDRQKSQYVDPDSSTDDTHLLDTLGTEIQLTWQSGIHTLVVGGDYYNDELNSTANGDHTQDRWSLFAQYETNPTSWAKILAGVRYDEHSAFGSVVSPKAGFVFTPTDTTTFHVSVGKSFRAPTLNDRFWPSAGYSYIDFFTGELIEGGTEGNPDLDPETTWEYEIGINQRIGEIATLKAAGFMRDAKDLIIWAEGNDNWYRPYNVTEARTWGAETSAEFLIHKKVTWGINYTYLIPKNRQTDEYIPNIPQHQAGSFLALGPFWDTKLRIGGRYVRYYDDPARTDRSYMIFDATLTRPFVIMDGLEIELLVSARNILDREYEVNKGYPMPPAEVQVGVSASF
jgi:outer membrane cobalamin receptor